MLRSYVRTFLFFIAISSASLMLSGFIGYRAVGFIFLIGVLGVGFVTTLGPVLFAAFLSTLAWNFLFIPPRFTFSILAPEDIMLCLTYFLAALSTGILTSKIRQREERLRLAELLKTSEKLHQTILNSISHELRTPLTAITASATALSDEKTFFHQQNRQDVLAELTIATDRLNRVIENLLDMSRLNSGMMALKKEWHDIQDLIGVCLQKLDRSLQGYKLVTDISPNLPLVHIDFRMMEHVITNILTNAAQYSPPGTEIKITAVSKFGRAVIVIEDNGRGVEPGELTKIFEKFYRATGTPAGGTGLGLSIAKSIIELHSGSIEAENRKEGGTRINLLLPLGDPPKIQKERDAASFGG